MNRRDFIQKLASCAFGAIMAPHPIPNLLVRNYAMLPGPISAFEDPARITAIGVGPMGSQMTQLLSRNLPGIECHDMVFSPVASHPKELQNLFSAVGKSDLLFALTGFDGANDGILFQAIGETAKEGGVLSVGITSTLSDGKSLLPEDLERATKDFDCTFSVSSDSLTRTARFLTHPRNNSSFTGYAMRHTVATITNLIQQQGIICVDFADVAHILRSGHRGFLGTGVASGPSHGRTAAILALDRLVEQGVSLQEARGFLVVLHASSLLKMEDFDEASIVVHDQVDDDADIIIGIVSDEAMGNNVKVSVMVMG